MSKNQKQSQIHHSTRVTTAFNKMNAHVDSLVYVVAYAILQRQMRNHWALP